MGLFGCFSDPEASARRRAKRGGKVAQDNNQVLPGIKQGILTTPEGPQLTATTDYAKPTTAPPKVEASSTVPEKVNRLSLRHKQPSKKPKQTSNEGETTQGETGTATEVISASLVQPINEDHAPGISPQVAGEYEPVQLDQCSTFLEKGYCPNRWTTCKSAHGGFPAWVTQLALGADSKPTKPQAPIHSLSEPAGTGGTGSQFLEKGSPATQSMGTRGTFNTSVAPERKQDTAAIGGISEAELQKKAQSSEAVWSPDITRYMSSDSSDIIRITLPVSSKLSLRLASKDTTASDPVENQECRWTKWEPPSTTETKTSGESKLHSGARRSSTPSRYPSSYIPPLSPGGPRRSDADFMSAVRAREAAEDEEWRRANTYNKPTGPSIRASELFSLPTVYSNPEVMAEREKAETKRREETGTTFAYVMGKV